MVPVLVVTVVKAEPEVVLFLSCCCCSNWRLRDMGTQGWQLDEDEGWEDEDEEEEIAFVSAEPVPVVAVATVVVAGVLAPTGLLFKSDVQRA